MADGADRVVLALTVVAANVLADTVRVGGGNGERERENAPAARRRPRRPVLPAAAGVPSGAAAVPPDRDPEALLEVRDLTVSAAGGPGLVTGVSFALRPGAVLGLVGESGCGKTMTARALPGLLPDGVAVTGGSVWFSGRDLTGLTENQLRAVRGREIALISQEPMVALDPVFSIGYQLTQPIRRFRGAGGHRVGRAEGRRIAADCSGRSASSTHGGSCAATRISSPAAWRSACASRSP